MYGLHQRLHCKSIQCLMPFSLISQFTIDNGGGQGIRTLGCFHIYSFQDCRLRPLGQSSTNSDLSIARLIDVILTSSYYLLASIGAGGGTRTLTISHWLLKPARLPFRHACTLGAKAVRLLIHLWTLLRHFVVYTNHQRLVPKGNYDIPTFRL